MTQVIKHCICGKQDLDLNKKVIKRKKNMLENTPFLYRIEAVGGNIYLYLSVSALSQSFETN